MCQLQEASDKLMDAIPRVQRRPDGMSGEASHLCVQAAVAKATKKWVFCDPAAEAAEAREQHGVTSEDEAAEAREPLIVNDPPEDPAVRAARESLERLGFRGRVANKPPLDDEAMRMLATSRLVGPRPFNQLFVSAADRGDEPLVRHLLQASPLFNAHRVHLANDLPVPHYSQWERWVAAADTAEADRATRAAAAELAFADDEEVAAATATLVDDMIAAALADVAIECRPLCPVVADAALDPTTDPAQVAAMMEAEGVMRDKTRAVAAAGGEESGLDGIDLIDEEFGEPAEVLEIGVSIGMQRAARKGHHAVVRLLMAGGCPIIIDSGDMKDAICGAAKAGQGEIARMLMDHFHEGDVSEAGGEAVWLAAKEGHDRVVDILLASPYFSIENLQDAFESVITCRDAAVVDRVTFVDKLMKHPRFSDFERHHFPYSVVSGVVRTVYQGLLVQAACCNQPDVVRLLTRAPFCNALYIVDALCRASQGGKLLNVQMLLESPLLVDPSLLQDPRMINREHLNFTLLRSASNVSFREKPLIEAVRGGHMKIFELLMAFPLFYQASSIATLWEAVAFNNAAAIRLLLRESRYHFNEDDLIQIKAMMREAQKLNYTEVVEELMRIIPLELDDTFDIAATVDTGDNESAAASGEVDPRDVASLATHLLPQSFGDQANSLSSAVEAAARDEALDELMGDPVLANLVDATTDSVIAAMEVDALDAASMEVDERTY